MASTQSGSTPVSAVLADPGRWAAAGQACHQGAVTGAAAAHQQRFGAWLGGCSESMMLRAVSSSSVAAHPGVLEVGQARQVTFQPRQVEHLAAGAFRAAAGKERRRTSDALTSRLYHAEAAQCRRYRRPGRACVRSRHPAARYPGRSRSREPACPVSIRLRLLKPPH